MLLLAQTTITHETNLTLPLTIVTVAIMFLVGAVWRAGELFHKLNASIEGLRNDLRYKVERRDFDKWTVELERGNRSVVKSGDIDHKPSGLSVPDLGPIEPAKGGN